MLTSTADRLLDDVGRLFGPDKGRGMAVPLLDIAGDVTNQGPDRLERAAADRLAREDSKPRLDHVEPGCALGSEVKVDRRMVIEPRLHGGGRMRGRVVEHDVQLAGAVAANHRFDESQEVGGGVPGRAVSDDPTGGDLQRRVQARVAIPATGGGVWRR